MAGKVGVVDVGGGSTEVILGTVAGGVEDVRSWRVGSGVLADELIASDPPSAAEIRKVRDRIDDFFAGSRSSIPARRSRSGAAPPRCGAWSARCSSMRRSSAGSGCSVATPPPTSARRFELDPQRVRILATGVLLLEKVSELLGQPLQIGKGGLREGVILDLLNGSVNGSSPRGRRRLSAAAGRRFLRSMARARAVRA